MIIEVTVPIRCDPANPPGYTEILQVVPRGSSKSG